MAFKETLKLYQGRVSKAIGSSLDGLIANSSAISSDAGQLSGNIKEFSLRKSKLIRPVLAVFGFKCVNNSGEEAVLNSCVSIELVHDYLLIHDDIMDEAVLRRGKPAFHKLYEKNYSAKLAEAHAVLAGDILAAFANEPILNSAFPDGLKLRALSKLNRIVIDTGFGQLVDMVVGSKKDFAEEDVELIHTFKTAKYTVEGPLHLGAILGGASEAELKVLSDYAIPVGRAFQIQDDILGVFGSEEKLGKSVTSDIVEGKKTLLVWKALEKAGKEDRKFILGCLENKNLSLNDFNKLKKIFAGSGALDYSKEKARQLAEQGKKAILASGFSAEGKTFLVEMADYLINREF